MYRFIPQQVVTFYRNFNKSYPTAAKCTFYVTRLDNLLVGFGEILPNDFEKCSKYDCTQYFEGIYQNFDLFLAKRSNFNMSKVDWVEIIEISIISRSSLVTLTRLILVGLLFDLFY